MVNIYGSHNQMQESANAIYRVTDTQGHKQIYYMYNILKTSDVKWPSSKKVVKGWTCVVEPTEDNLDDRSLTYEYPEINLSDIEDTWFRRELGVKDYQRVKYDPVILESYSNDDSDSDMFDGDGEDSSNSELEY